MANSLLKKNEGKTGSYTINVREGYAVPKRGLKEIVRDISKPIRRSSTGCRVKKSQAE